MLRVGLCLTWWNPNFHTTTDVYNTGTKTAALPRITHWCKMIQDGKKNPQCGISERDAAQDVNAGDEKSHTCPCDTSCREIAVTHPGDVADGDLHHDRDKGLPHSPMGYPIKF